MRIALVFDALFPVTKGGAERWFTALATELAELGHEVTYVTADRGELPEGLPFSVHEVVRSRSLYTADGNRRLLPSVQFGVASGWWLRRNRRRFDAVYVHQTPLFSVIAARLALGRRVPWAVEWIEWWTRDYWLSYAPGLVGRSGWLIQRVALAATPLATVFARSTRARLLAERPKLDVRAMPGQIIDRSIKARDHWENDPIPLVLVVGRLVPEKRPNTAIAAIAEIARSRPVRGRIIGQGPLLSALRDHALATGFDIEVLGPVDQKVLEDSYREAAVLLHPSEREGFGLVVAEAAARGTPVVVVDGPDNAAVELIEPAVNGFVSPTRQANDLAAAVRSVLDSGAALRSSASSWFAEAANTRSVGSTAAQLAKLLEEAAQEGRARK